MPNAKSIEKVGKSTIFGIWDNEMADGSLAEVAEKVPSRINGYTFSDKQKPDDLPVFIRAIYEFRSPACQHG